jgi:hypothetical protein
VYVVSFVCVVYINVCVLLLVPDRHKILWLYWEIIEKEFDAVLVPDNDGIYCVSVCVCARARACVRA